MSAADSRREPLKIHLKIHEAEKIHPQYSFNAFMIAVEVKYPGAQKNLITPFVAFSTSPKWNANFTFDLPADGPVEFIIWKSSVFGGLKLYGKGQIETSDILRRTREDIWITIIRRNPKKKPADLHISWSLSGLSAAPPIPDIAREVTVFVPFTKDGKIILSPYQADITPSGRITLISHPPFITSIESLPQVPISVAPLSGRVSPSMAPYTEIAPPSVF